MLYNFEWDPEKAKINKNKHKVNFEHAATIFKDPRAISIYDSEHYNFTGFNMHIGFLWQANQWFTLGGILKTPFMADIKHEYRSVSIIDYPQNLARTNGYASQFRKRVQFTKGQAG